jgi:hypothetical protein
MINANISRDLHGLVTWCGMALFTGRETNFYGSPVIKGFVIIVTSSSFLYHMFRSVLPSNEVLLTCLQSIGLPTASLWVMGVVLLYWIRPLERHLGSVKFIVSFVCLCVCESIIRVY